MTEPDPAVERIIEVWMKDKKWLRPIVTEEIGKLRAELAEEKALFAEYVEKTDPLLDKLEPMYNELAEAKKDTERLRRIDLMREHLICTIADAGDHGWSIECGGWDDIERFCAPTLAGVIDAGWEAWGDDVEDSEAIDKSTTEETQ